MDLHIKQMPTLNVGNFRKKNIFDTFFKPQDLVNSRGCRGIPLGHSYPRGQYHIVLAYSV